MSYVILTFAGLVGLAVGAVAGFKIGSVIGGRRPTFWLLVALLFIVTTVAVAQATRTDALWLAAAALGVLAGGLTGLKYGSDAELRSLVTPRGR